MPNGRITLTGSRIRARRMDAGLRQAELAQTAGISPSYLNLIEHNRRRIGGRLLNDLARLLGVDPAHLSDGAERGLLDRMLSAAAGQDTGAEVTRAEEFATRYPGWAALVAGQSDRIAELSARVQELTDRLTHDPALATALHGVISAATSIRSTASILATDDSLDADWLQRFHNNIHEDAIRLGDSSEALVNFLDVPTVTGSVVHQPIAEVERWLARHDWHIGMIEDGADAARVCAGAGKGGQALSPHALQMLLVHLEQYASDAAQLPMPAFAAAARAADYDAAALAHMLSVPLSRVLRRLAALPPDDGHPPVGLVTCDAAGAITLFKQVPGFSLHRGGLACPLWPLFTALGQLGRPLWCDAMLPDAAASRLRCVAIAVQTGEASITMPPLVTSTMIVITDLPKGPDETLLLGPSCRICSRLDCPARREPSALAAGQ